LKATVLQEGESEHRHERMAVKTLPGSSLEVVEAESLFQLMRMLANPSCLYGGGQSAQIGRGRQIGEVVLLLSRRPVFADEPSLIPPGDVADLCLRSAAVVRRRPAHGRRQSEL
jgi:hypothetical protein